MGLDAYVLNAAVAGVVSQRLVRKLCPECKRPSTASLSAAPPEAAEYARAEGEATFYEAVGCEACRGTGYRGRTAIHEILIMDDRLRDAVAAGDLAAMRRAARDGGMLTLREDGVRKAAEGVTSLAEVVRVTAGLS